MDNPQDWHPTEDEIADAIAAALAGELTEKEDANKAQEPPAHNVTE